MSYLIHWVVRKIRVDFEGKLKRRRFKFLISFIKFKSFAVRTFRTTQYLFCFTVNDSFIFSEAYINIYLVPVYLFLSLSFLLHNFLLQSKFYYQKRSKLLYLNIETLKNVCYTYINLQRLQCRFFYICFYLY